MSIQKFENIRENPTEPQKKKKEKKRGTGRLWWVESPIKRYNPSTNFSSVSPVVSPTIPKSLGSPPRLGVLSCGSIALCSGVPRCPCSMEPGMGVVRPGCGDPVWDGTCCGDGCGWTCGEGLECGGSCRDGGLGDCTGAGEHTWLLSALAMGWPARCAPCGWPESRWACGLMGLDCAGEPIGGLRTTCCCESCCCCWSMRWCRRLGVPSIPIWPMGPPDPCMANCCCCCCIRSCV